MKTFCLIRHAKSSWDNPSLRDIQRPLNARGKRDAPFMAEKLSELGVGIELCLSSPSQRTRETLIPFITAYDIAPNEVEFIDELFHGSLIDILNSVRAADDKVDSLMLFAHNPGMTVAANYFNDGYIHNVPTCGISLIRSDAKSWAEVNQNNSRLEQFIYPKKYI